MRAFLYGLGALVMLAVVMPAVSFAESEDNEATGDGQERQSAGSQQGGDDGSDGSAGHGSYGLVLPVTIAAIMAVVGYSGWKVYKARRKAAAKNLV